MKLLSILIPTYNRASFLDESLSVIVPQVKKYKDFIEIAISDNASEDNTKSIVEKYADIIDIKYTRNDNNIGFDRNFQQLLKNSDGKYVYLMGDDDISAPCFLDTIIPLLKEDEEFSIIHWNRLVGDAECKNASLFDKEYETIEWSSSSKEFILKILDKANFISSLVFNKECWFIGEKYAKASYEGYEWFARLYWGSLLHNKKCVYLYYPLVIQRNPAKSWIQNWPLYFISSTSNIFFDLDAQVPGVYKKWRTVLKTGLPDCLPLVGLYRTYYRQTTIKKGLLRHLDRRYKLMFYYYMIPGTYTFHVIKIKAIHFINKLLN